MLQLLVNNLDVIRVSKLLVKYNIKASISANVITLEGDISEELISKLCKEVDVSSVQNYLVQTADESINSEASISSESALIRRSGHHETCIPCKTPKYDLLFPTVKRGEVYICDLGEPYGLEIGYKRPVIIFQNDCMENESNALTTVLYIAHSDKNYRTNYSIQKTDFADLQGYFDFNSNSKVLCCSAPPIDKSRLRIFVGTLKSEVMDIFQQKLSFALGFKYPESEKIYVEKPVEVKPTAQHDGRDISITQIQLLSMVDTNKLFNISQSNSTDEAKAKQILELFGFDLSKNGIQYILKAILISPSKAYFNLETLSKEISKEDNVSEEEILRLIVARVKEIFKFKKTPTIDFIRLVNIFLTKKEIDS